MRSQGQRRVLVFPAGTEIGLEIYNALKHCKEVKLYAAGQNCSNHAKFIYSEYCILPSIYEAGWLDALIALVNKHQIDYIFPAYDDIILALSKVIDQIPSVIITSPAQACEITRSKSASYRFLAEKVKVPLVYDSVEKIVNYPVLVKPDCGQGSQGIRCVHNAAELSSALSDVKDPIICEYLPGEEYTVDCFSDRVHGLIFARARRRRRIRNGISVNTITEQLPEAWDIAEKIGQAFELRGAWFFQLKRSEAGDLVLLEVAPRIAGAMAANRVLGINFPLLSIFEHERLNVRLLINQGDVELDRALLNRYRYKIDFKLAYIDLDDTLILHGEVNLLVIKFIYQCINKGKAVKLLTRHRYNLNETLRRHRLLSLFDDVIHIAQDKLKSEIITEPDAIFIDDSFSERLDVAQRCNIPTFDCSMLEVLTESACSNDAEEQND